MCEARAGFGNPKPAKKKKPPPGGKRGGGGKGDGKGGYKGRSRSSEGSRDGGPAATTALDNKHLQGDSRFKMLDSVYDHPEFYDLAFSYRDFEAEADFMYDVYEQTHEGQGPKTFVELGCGPAQHCMELADSEMAVYGVDNNPKMLDYARDLAASLELEVNLIDSDMADFELPEGVEADIVAIPLASLAHCLTNEEVVCTFSSVADCLAPTGLLFVEITHPGLLFSGNVVGSGDTWQVEMDDGSQAEVWWGDVDDAFDSITQVLSHTVQMDINRGGELFRVRQVLPLRQFTFHELDLMGEMCGLKIVAGFGDMDTKVPLVTEDPYRMVLVFQKTPDVADAEGFTIKESE